MIKESFLFIFIAIFITYCFWLPAAYLTINESMKELIPFLHFLGGVGPVSAAVLLEHFLPQNNEEIFSDGKKTMYSISLVYFLSISVPFFITMITNFIYFNNEGRALEFSFLNFFAAFLFTALIIYLEERGWRGFLYPRLKKATHPIIAILIVGISWSLWHFPLFLYSPPHRTSDPIHFLSYTAGLISLSGLISSFIRMTHSWKNALAVGILSHASFNGSIAAHPSLMENLNNYFFPWSIICILCTLIILLLFPEERKEEKKEN